MHVVGAGEPPELLPGDVGPAEQRVAAEVAPAVAVGVDRQLRVAGDLGHADEADRVEADHHAGAAELQHQVVVAAHGVEIVGDVEGEHHLAADALGVAVDRAHHGAGARVEGAGRAIGLELVVLDEVDAGLAEAGDELAGAAGVDDAGGSGLRRELARALARRPPAR